MSTQTKTITSYTIDSHPNPEAVFNWIRDNWHDMNEHSLNELVASLKAVACAHDLNLDYSISTVPDRGEHITLTDTYADTSDAFKPADLPTCGNYPYTGVHWDEIVMDAIRQDDLSGCEGAILKALHDDTEHAYSDEALRETCEANDYYFLVDGSLA